MSSEEDPAQPVRSNQSDIHQALAGTVRRHLRNGFLKPYAQHTVDAFQSAKTWLDDRSGSCDELILDAGCGVGESTAWLAGRHPGALVIGVDKSASRLARSANYRAAGDSDNAILVRADLVDFWRLCADAKWRLRQHTIFYPNPWPKPGQLQRRWHGSPVFPDILALGGRLELRSNWSLYVAEFAAALRLVGVQAAAEPFESSVAVTPFERKYGARGHILWRCVADLDALDIESVRAAARSRSGPL